MKEPFITINQVKEIVKSYPTPFYIYDEKQIRENARKLKQAFSWNKGFHEYFAVKATPNPSIIKILKEEGCGVDCATLSELELVNRFCNMTGEEIMFSSNDTPVEDFKMAVKLNSIINFDDIKHIDFYEKQGLPFGKAMCCRYNPGRKF